MNKKIMILMSLSLMVVLSFSVSAVTHITDCTGLQNIQNNLAEDYVLDNDIDCSATSGWNDGAGFEPIGTPSSPFKGNFDGQGHIITGLFINRSTQYYTGLFGYAYDVDIEIKNIGLEDIYINGYYYAGGLVGYGGYGNISSSYVTGSITGLGDVGGLTGYNYYFDISDSYSLADIDGDYEIGGLAGFSQNSDIYNSYSAGSVKGKGSIGGLLGKCYGNTCNIYNSYYVGDLNGTDNHINMIAGSIFSGYITNSYSWSGATCVGCSADIKSNVRSWYSSGQMGIKSCEGGGNPGCLRDNSESITLRCKEEGCLGGYSSGSSVSCDSGCTYGHSYSSDGNSWLQSCSYDGAGKTCTTEITCTGCDYPNGIAESDKSNFYLKTYDVYDSNMPYWDFTNIWEERSGNFPKLKWQIISYTILEPSWPAGIDLYDTEGNVIGSTTELTKLQLRNLGDKKVEFDIEGNLDLSSVTVDSDDERTVVGNLGTASGVTGTHIIYVPNDNGAGVYVCPDASSLSAVVPGCSNIETFTDAECVAGASKSIGGDTVTCTIDGIDYKISGLSGSGAGTLCDSCEDCDEGLYCELRNATATCQDRATNNPPACVDCLDNDLDGFFDNDGWNSTELGDPGCTDYNDNSEVDGGVPGAIPEFSTIGIILALIITALGVMIIKKKE